MSRLIVRFQSLALRDEGSTSFIHFDVEDEHAIHRCRARVEEREASVDVGDLEGFRGVVDHAGFAEVVERIYREQVAKVARIASVVSLDNCIVALREREIVIEGGRVAAGW